MNLAVPEPGGGQGEVGRDGGQAVVPIAATALPG